MAGPTEIGIKLIEAGRAAYSARLAAMDPKERKELVDAARKERNWPSVAWLAEHARTHGEGRTAEQYADWARAIKSRPRTRVYAMFHVARMAEGLAFLDPVERSIVWVRLSDKLNVSCFYLDEPADDFLADQGAMYWRMEDTELQ